MYTVIIRHVDTSDRPNGKQFRVIMTEVQKDSKAKAWKLCLDTQRKAANSATIALVNLEVCDSNHKVVWSLH